jgi:DNA-directed RNA polymerase subunit RPC12/RpoP
MDRYEPKPNVQFLVPRFNLKTGGKETRGPSEKDMVCGNCYRFFVLTESSWAAAERKACPHCGSKETTPMLCEFDNGAPVFVKDEKGGFI